MTTTPPHELFQMLRGKTIRDLNEWPEQLHKSSEGVGHKLAELAKDEYRSLISIDGFCRQVEDSLCQLTGLADQLSSSVTQKLRNAGDKFALITTGAPDGGLISQIAGCRQILKTYGKLSALLEVHRVMVCKSFFKSV
jgi:hypothetical protein